MGAPDKKPKALIWFDSGSSSGPIATTERFSEALQKKGFEVVLLRSIDASLRKTQFAGNPRRLVYSEYMTGLQLLQFLKETSDREQPDVIVTEGLPFAPAEEGVTLLAEWLSHARAGVSKPQIYSISRDVPHFNMPLDSHSSRQEDMASHWAGTLFDAIFVRGDQAMIPFRQFFKDLKNWEKFSSKLVHTGYIVPPKDPNKTPGGGGVVVHLGGGVSSDDLRVYTATLNAIPALKNEELKGKEWNFYVSDQYAEECFNQLRMAKEALPPEIRDHVHIRQTEDSYLDKVEAADMMVVRGGMAAVEAVAYNRPTVILPRACDPLYDLHDEQGVRAKALQRVAPYRATIVGVDDQESPEKIAKAMEFIYAQRHIGGSAGPRINGAENAAQLILDRYRDPAAELKLSGLGPKR